MTCASCGMGHAAAIPCGSPSGPIPLEGNPRGQISNTDPNVHPLANPSCSLIDALGKVADDVRQIYTDLGARPYRVFSVVYRWTGGAIGRGEPIVESELELLPTPSVDLMGVQGSPREAGIVERGNVTLKQISPRYTEDQVRGLFFVDPLPPDRQGFIEVTVDARDGTSPRRRFTVVGVPTRFATSFEWQATMVREDASRTRSALPNPVTVRADPGPFGAPRT